MKAWMAAAEIAALNLPGLPETAQGVNKAARLNGWKARPRSGRGGGNEYETAALPLAARVALSAIEAREEAKRIEIGEVPIPSAPAFAGDHPTNAKAALRRDARLVIINLFSAFQARSRLNATLARELFCYLYNRAGEAEADENGNHVARQDDYAIRVPAWVRQTKPTVSKNSIANWIAARDRGDASRLAGAYKGKPKGGTLGRAEDGRVAQFIAARIVAQPHLTSDHLRDLVRAEFGDTIAVEGRAVPLPPIRTFQRFAATWKAEHRETLMKMTDPDRFKNVMRASGTNMNSWVSALNQLWEIDASPADVLLLDGRHSIYSLIDIYSRRMIVTVSKTARTEAVLSLIRKAIEAWGVPDIIRTDNGSDFTSHWAVSAIAGLGIKTDVCDPFSPEQKGSVERSIRTLQHGLMPLLPGYVGHSVADRKQIEARRAFAQRLGESPEKAFCVELAAEEFQRIVDDWCATKYANKPHAGLGGKTPFQMAAAWTKPLRRIENARALDLFLAPVAGKDGFRTVTKFGIRVDGANFLHPDLVPATRVFCRQDPADMGRVVVYAEDRHTFLAIAECPERLGADPGAAVRALREAQATRLETEVKPLQREIRTMKPRDMIDAVLGVAKADAEKVIALPKRTEFYTSLGLDGAAEAARAMDGHAPARTAEPKAARVVTIERFEAPKSDIQMKRERWARARDLRARVEAGEPITPEDTAWLTHYVTTPEGLGLVMVSDTSTAEEA